MRGDGGMASYQLGFGSGLGGWGVGFWLGDGGWGDFSGSFLVFYPSRSTIHIPIDEQGLRHVTFRIFRLFSFARFKRKPCSLITMGEQWESDGQS